MTNIEQLYSKFILSTGVSIDTRTMLEGNIFFAINGPNFNANEFAFDALESGALYAVVDEKKYVRNDKYILVEDGLTALQELAKFHRGKFQIPFLGITGSNGKTTTKELIVRVLSEKLEVHATEGNLNNHIGVPLTLLKLKKNAEVAVIEMGANHVGEIASYCQIAKPTHGLITNIGRAHTETFGGIEGIIRGKSELFDYLRKNQGTVFINNTDKVLSNMAKRFIDPILYPSRDLELLETVPYLKIKLSNLEMMTKTIGKFNYINIAAAVAIGSYFDVSDQQILTAISSYESDNSRSQIIKYGTTTVILDAYNANPDSMRAALHSLAEVKGNKVAILGDMNELENSDAAHKEVLDYAHELQIEKVLTVGSKIGKVADRVNHFDSKEVLEDKLNDMDLDHSTVLLKASRSIKLETILKSLQ